ncbi:MAG: hypothetical protein GY797_10325 [Deltaproteobacteria bacterium]|nr:hypothetical protein [Deltaproteobacteria bacterium]
MKNDRFCMFKYLLIFALMTFYSPNQDLKAQTGVFFKRTLTFAQNGTAQFDFTVSGPKLNEDVTTVWFEFSSYDSLTVLPGPFAGVSFELERVVPAIPPLSLTDGLDNDKIWATDKRIQFNDMSSSPSNAPRLFKLDITHFDVDIIPDGIAFPLGSTENWRINISSFPVGTATAPSARLIAFISDTRGEFINLTPVGTGNVKVEVEVNYSGPTDSLPPLNSKAEFVAIVENAPVGAQYSWSPLEDAKIGNMTIIDDFRIEYTLRKGDSDFENKCCNNIGWKFEVEDKSGNPLASDHDFILIKDLSFCEPGPPPNCLLHHRPGGGRSKYIDIEKLIRKGKFDRNDPSRYHQEWYKSVPEGYNRKSIIFKPIDNNGSMLGPGRGDEIKLEVKNAEVIGSLIDTQDDHYMQTISYKKGVIPSINISVGEATTGEILVDKPPDVSSFIWVLIGIIVLLVAYIIIQIVQRGKTPRTSS